MAEKDGNTLIAGPSAPASNLHNHGKGVATAAGKPTEPKSQAPTGSLASKIGSNLHSNKPASPRFPVTHEESWEIFGLFETALLADGVAARLSSAAAPAKLSQKTVNALFYLLKNKADSTTITEMAERMQISLGWASRLADELVINGLVTRSRDDRDLRNVRLNLTPAAKSLTGKLWNERENAVASALAEIPPEKRNLISVFLRRLTEEMQRRSRHIHRFRPKAGKI